MNYFYKLFDSSGFPYLVPRSKFFEFVNQSSYIVYQVGNEFHFFTYEVDCDDGTKSFKDIGYFTVSR